MEFNLSRVAFLQGRRMLDNIMKTFLFLFCSSVFSLTSGTIFSQNATIKITSDATMTIDEVFEVIKQQTDYNFIYKSDLFEGYPKVSVKKGLIKAEKLLKHSLSSGNFIIKMSDDNTIIIGENWVSDQQEDVVITGQVKDVNGIPLPGMTVYITSQRPVGERLDREYLLAAT